MPGRVGTLAWAEETGGRLSLGDKARLVADGLGLLFRTMPDRLRYQFGGRIKVDGPVDLSAWSAPDTAVAKASFELCARISPRFMVTHCARTYWYARLLGHRWGVHFDDEVLYIGAMLHDISMMEGFEGRTPEEHCFTIAAARCARGLVEEAGWARPRQDQVAEAIVLNPNSDVRPSQGAEAHLLNAGVLVDAIGLHLWELHPETVSALIAREPRLDLKRSIPRYVHAEADAHPGCRFHFARRYFQFHRQVAAAPFDE